MPMTPTETEIRGEDWDGRDTHGQSYTRVAFIDVDLLEGTNRGGVFTECAFRRSLFNASSHTHAAFINCTFTGCSFFDASFIGCKLVGSLFDRCTFGLLTVTGGDWSFVGLAGADLRKASITGVRMREANLAGARCQGATLQYLDLSGAVLQGADLSRADLRGLRPLLAESSDDHRQGSSDRHPAGGRAGWRSRPAGSSGPSPGPATGCCSDWMTFEESRRREGRLIGHSRMLP